MSVATENGQITARISDASLDSVLMELGARTGVAFVAADDIDTAAVRISAALSGVPLDQGIRLLLNNFDVFFYYGAVGTDPASLRAVWIYRKGAGANLRPVPPEAWGSTRELHANLADPDPIVRARAYEALLSRPDQESRELVIHALRGSSEPDDGVRERILAIASGSDMRLPSDLLLDLARWDRSPKIRLNALNVLASESAGKEAARAALNDPSARVRKRAREILAELETRPQ
jgi:hypothetical protein